ncbi:MAG: lysylphosphatidylglycerol synthase transmembrane domain-containing protein [Thermoanaerobaculum sp.]
MSRPTLRAAGLVVGSALAAALAVAAEPARILELFANTPARSVAAAFFVHTAILATRAFRLRLLAAGKLPYPQAFLLFATTQTASALLPWRLGELALPPVARWALRARLSHGAFWWLGGRFFDLWSLSLVVAAGALGGVFPSFFLPPALGLFAASSAAAFWATHRRLWHALSSLLPSRRLIRGVLGMRRVLAAFGQEKMAVASCFGLSVGSWALIVGFTDLLCQAMDPALSLRQVAAAVLGATLGAALPISGVGNLGPLEAGFASALSLSGVAATKALAVGFALHLWTLVFQIAVGLPAALLLAWNRPR